MGFFSKKKPELLPNSKDLEREVHRLRDKNQFFLLTILILFRYLKDFSFDLQEIRADVFKETIDRLAQGFESEAKTQKVIHLFETHKADIPAFIDREKEYFSHRDAEFKQIIQILSSGIVTLDSENQAFNQRVQEESLKLEKITQLNDIRKLKAELEEGVAQLKTFIEEKKGRDAKQMQFLSSEVEDLKIELKKTKDASLTDALSGAYNRAAFDAHIARMLSNGKQGFSLLMLDIDDFKKINDTYGHRVGDRVIMALVQKCKNLIRGDDFLARYGGEEFVMVLPGALLKQATKKAQAICKEIAGTQYALDDSGKSPPLSFRVSVGVSSFQKRDTVESIVERADKALYQAKRTGKNRAVNEDEL